MTEGIICKECGSTPCNPNCSEVGLSETVSCSKAIDYKAELERLVGVCEQAMESRFESRGANRVIINAVKHYKSIGVDGL